MTDKLAKQIDVAESILIRVNMIFGNIKCHDHCCCEFCVIKQGLDFYTEEYGDPRKREDGGTSADDEGTDT